MLKNLGRRNIIPSCRQLLEQEEENGDVKENDRVPKSYIPVMVGLKEGKKTKFLIHVKMFKKACFVELLEMIGDEFGYEHEGVLHIPCDATSFIQTVKRIPKSSY
ncbi:hypothetical protein JCGZ_09195 [Jatropha curcas]|uniref:SAUR family protein n=1 Tax=Jatropha curcas TaxID=180498 RepID=A0A067KFK2_JATCU|nr:hypothetical protein JCGZ_09195 [Jatropha curcas]